MKKTLFSFIALAVLAGGQEPSAQQAPRGAPSLVGTFTLVSVEQIDGGTLAAAQGARGLLVFDAAGHAFEIVSRPNLQAGEGMTEAQVRFHRTWGFWGGYRADAREGRIAYEPLGGPSPNVMGSRFSRTFEWAGDRLVVTSVSGEPHTPGVRRWTWERVPTVDNLSEGYRSVVGFWQHVVEKRVNASTGAVLSESRRAPSVIVYTPAGFVGVHFPTLDRPRIAGAEPTDQEARALGNYLGYFGALGVYPGMVFHNILGGGGVNAGSILKRFYELKGDELTVRFPPNLTREGQPVTTLVTLKRLSGARDMLGR